MNCSTEGHKDRPAEFWAEDPSRARVLLTLCDACTNVAAVLNVKVVRIKKGAA